MNNHKKIILLAFISLVIIGSLCLLFYAMNIISSKTSGTQPSSYPTSYTNPDNIIKIDDNKNKVYRYAVITNDDTIELRNNFGEKFIIGLDHRKWKSVKWSPDNTSVAVLGETRDKVYDLFIYNVIAQSWLRATQFQNATSGVDNFVWKDKDNLLFIQGLGSEKWIQKFNYPSQTEILKLNKTNADIVSISNDRKYLLGKENNVFSIINNQGKEIVKLNNIVDDNGNLLNITNVLFSSDSDKLVFKTKDGLLYKATLGDIKAALLEDIKDLTPVCNIGEDIFLGYDYYDIGNRIRISNLNVKESTSTIVAESVIKDIKSINPTKSLCFEKGNILLDIKFEQDKWYEINKGELEEMAVLKGIAEVSINNL